MSQLALILLLLLLTIGLAGALATFRARTHTFRDRVKVALGMGEIPDSEVLARCVSLRRLAADSERYHRQLSAAAAAIDVGIVIVDKSGAQVFANETATHYAAPTAGDALVGLRLRNVIKTIVDSTEPIEHEIELLSPAPRTILLRAMPLLHKGERLGSVAFIEDLTDRSHVDSIRRDFVANASHELKTPIGALRLLAEALVATDDDGTRHRLSERIQQEAGRMTRLVEDILDLGLVEEDQTVRGVVDLCDVLTDALDQVALISEILDIPVASSCVPVAVMGDQRRLVSAVANLVENAITFTHAKGLDQPEPVEVAVSRSGDQALIEVRDHGIGIPERHRNRIFERFYRADRGRSRASGGTGLGLAIVRHVVQNHWGEIEVESTPGEGSTFRISLPAREE